MSALRVENLGVTIEGTAILTDISVYAAPGEWLGVIGPNGAGKSTLLHAACGVVGFTGRVLLGGDPLETLDRRACASRVALVPQTPVVPPGMSVVDYVLLGRTPHRSALGAESDNDRAVVVEVLRQLDLVRFARRLLTTLSGGERQRVLLARALAVQADVLLMDEPLANLDPPHQSDWLRLVRTLRAQGTTIISVLHEVTMALHADEMVLMVQGRIAHQGACASPATHRALEQVFDQRIAILPLAGQWVALPRN